MDFLAGIADYGFLIFLYWLPHSMNFPKFLTLNTFLGKINMSSPVNTKTSSAKTACPIAT